MYHSNMKALIEKILISLGLFEKAKVVREKYFPTKYEKISIIRQHKYIDFYKNFISKNDLVFDVGANMGHRTNIFLKLGAKVISVEPQKSLCRYLKEKFGNRIIIENCGLGQYMEAKEFYINSANSLSTFSPQWKELASADRFSDTRWVGKETIEIKTLDSLVSIYGNPKFCKIDVEGYELEVLSGLSTPIEFISFEFMIPENRHLILDCFSRLQNISSNFYINYSLGDSMQFSLIEWMPSSRTLDFMNIEDFEKPNWGDIYIHFV